MVYDNPRRRSRCEAVLAREVGPETCADFRASRRYVLCKTWRLLNAGEAKTFREAMIRAWQEFKGQCMAEQRMEEL